MTEKIESMEIHPMRGHSRGEWYCSLDDIVPSEDEAEYWAVFGVTHRGDKHYLGEFLTKAAAASAAHGIRSLWMRKATVPPRKGRKIVQIEVLPDRDDSMIVNVFALCDDGTVWRRGVGKGKASGFIDSSWEQISLDGIDDLPDKVTFGTIVASQN